MAVICIRPIFWCGSVNIVLTISVDLSALGLQGIPTKSVGSTMGFLMTSTIVVYLETFRYGYRYALRDQSLLEKEVSYHIYNLFAIARLKLAFGDHPFFDSEFVSRTIGFVDSALLEVVSRSSFGLSYNVPGFEVRLVHNVLGSIGCVRDLEGKQFDLSRAVLDGNAFPDDPFNYFARHYEYALSGRLYGR